MFDALSQREFWVFLLLLLQLLGDFLGLALGGMIYESFYGPTMPLWGIMVLNTMHCHYAYIHSEKDGIENHILRIRVLYIVSCLYLEITFLILSLPKTLLCLEKVASCKFSKKKKKKEVANCNVFSVFKRNRHVSVLRSVLVFYAYAREKRKKILSTKK